MPHGGHISRYSSDMSDGGALYRDAPSGYMPHGGLHRVTCLMVSAISRCSIGLYASWWAQYRDTSPGDMSDGERYIEMLHRVICLMVGTISRYFTG